MANEKEMKIETKKVVVESELELIDILDILEETEADRVILTFTEPSDILISAINLKVILETADENKKSVISQVIQNSVGLKNAKEVGMSVIETTGAISEGVWEEAEKGMRDRLKAKDEKLQSTNMKIKEKTPEEKVEKENVEEDIAEMEDVKPADSAFYKKIEEAIQRSKQGLSSQGKGRVVEHGGTVLALDQDIDTVNKVTQKPQNSLIGKDIGAFKPKFDDEDDLTEKAPPRSKLQNNTPNVMSGLFASLGKLPAKIGSAFAQKQTKKILLRIALPLLMIGAVSLWLVYELAPLVKVKMYIESKEVSIDKVFTGQPGVNTFNYEKGTIPVKKEEITKDASGNTTATGKAYRGNKAEGVATLTFFPESPDSEPVTVPGGTFLTTTEGFKYTTNSAVTLFEDKQYANISKPVAVTAAAVGEEYNLASGQYMTVAGYAEDELVAQNGEAFTGGSKEEYTVLSKSDVDNVVNDLKDDALADAKSELERKAGDDWEIIESTVKQELDGSATTDVPIGAEADIVNISISTKSTAIYYKRGEIESKVEEVLEKSAQDQNLFESSTDTELKLDSDITKEISVQSVRNEVVKIKLTASTKVKPEINKDEIIKQLKDLSWEDGKKVLESFTFTTKATEVSFKPDYFPKGVRYFPSRQGRILISIVETD